ncbi:MAG: PAS domain-containing protein [Rhodobacteraceae bacterium]|nr:PAS domain-containing protein [Paracoccaceae bacterium]
MTFGPPSSLLNALPNPAMIIGPQERVLAINQPAIKLFGTDGTDRHYITALRQPALLDAVEQVLAKGRVQRSRYLASEAGRDTTWQVHLAPVSLADGAGVMLSFEDITAVEEAGAMRRDFVANVSHELRTPLTALLGFIETMRGPAKTDLAAHARFLAIMAHEAGRMERLVDDLLSLSLVEENERVRPQDQVDISALIAAVVSALEPVARKSEITLELELAAPGVMIVGDAEQLRQVLSNLIENAVKYSSLGSGATSGSGAGRVTVRLSAPAIEPSLRVDAVRICVVDYGEGIALHHISRLTERFYRVDSHRSRKIGGTGLGLAIVKHIINRHRGRLQISSTIGEGSTFRVILPVSVS